MQLSTEIKGSTSFVYDDVMLLVLGPTNESHLDKWDERFYSCLDILNKNYIKHKLYNNQVYKKNITIVQLRAYIYRGQKCPYFK